METLLTTVIASTFLITSAFAAPQASVPHQAFTRVLPQEEYVGYVVEEDSSLAAIAQKAYGTEEYWTVLWNDNAWIADPEIIAMNSVLKIRTDKPEEITELTSELVERNNEITKQKNDAYMRQISMLPVVTVLPTVTVVPTQTVPVASTNTPSPISEEAITYLGNCEAGMDPTKNTGNGYYGAFQFSTSTWNRLNTGYARADLAPIEVQKEAVKQLLQRSSIHTQFPACANRMRNEGLI